MKRMIVLVAALALLSHAARGAEQRLADDSKAAMERATVFFRSIATNGGYVGIYSLDLKERYGEALYEKAADNEIWVQPPGTPSVGECYLRAYRITGDKRYLDAACDVGRALAWGQRSEGGWDHRVVVTHMKPGAAMPERMSGRCTLDDDITQGALKFLMNLDRTIDEPWLDDSIRLGLQFMMESQFDNGAWPQWYPLIGGYHDYYTFNDNTINDCIMFMMSAHRMYGDSRYFDTVKKGGDFIIASQIKPPQQGWAQQYSHDMQPAWARAFEPPGVCSAVTARNIRTLVDIYHYTRDPRYLEPIPAAIDWLERSKIGDNLWARLYEMGTNRPIYGDRDNKVHYTLEEISEERRKGYSWQSAYGVESSITYYREAKASGPSGPDIAERVQTSSDRARRAAALEPQAREVISGLDERGRWVNSDDSRIYCRDFVRNFNILCDYIEAVK